MFSQVQGQDWVYAMQQVIGREPSRLVGSDAVCKEGQLSRPVAKEEMGTTGVTGMDQDTIR